MKVLVTGGAGFIGSHVVDALVAAGAHVIALDSLDPGVHRSVPAYLNARAEYVFCDLRLWRPDDRVSDVEALVHFAALGGVGRAAREPANVIEANAGGTARLMEFTRTWPALRRVIAISSFSVYGGGYRYRCVSCDTERNGERRPDDLDASRYDVYCVACGSTCAVLPIREDSPAMPLETYGATKYMQELCWAGYAHCPMTILRFSSVYGPRMRYTDSEATIIAKLAGWISRREVPVLYEDGAQVRDWVHVDDVVDVIRRILAGAAAPPVVNVCSGQPTSLLEACHVLAAVLRTAIEPRIAGGYRPGDMRACLGDSTRLQQLIGRTPVAFTDGAAMAFRE